MGNGFANNCVFDSMQHLISKTETKTIETGLMLSKTVKTIF